MRKHDAAYAVVERCYADVCCSDDREYYRIVDTVSSSLAMSWAWSRPCRNLLVQPRPGLTFRATLAMKRTGSGSVQPSPVEGVSRTPSPLPPEPRRQQRALAVVLGFGVHHAGDATGVSGEHLNQCTGGPSAHIPAWACCVQMVLAASMLCVASSC